MDRHSRTPHGSRRPHSLAFPHPLQPFSPIFNSVIALHFLRLSLSGWIKIGSNAHSNLFQRYSTQPLYFRPFARGRSLCSTLLDFLDASVSGLQLIVLCNTGPSVRASPNNCIHSCCFPALCHMLPLLFILLHVNLL